MLKKKILASAVAATLATGLFVSGSAQAVAINPDNYGQVLLGPIYDVFDGFTNVVRVVNTSTVDAVKTKLVLRSAIDSRECRDVILYLTPGDVAELTISPHSDRFKATLYSNDDSLVSGMNGQQPTFASQVPYQSETSTADIFRPATAIVNGRPNGDHCAIGHIEVVGAYAVRGLIHTPAGDVAVRNGMSKGDLYKIFSTDRATLNSLNSTNPPVSTIWDANWGRIALLGSVDVTLNGAGDRIIVPMTPLVSSAADYLIANEAFDVTVGAQTSIGQAWGVGGSENLPAIENTLNAHSMQAIYDNNSTRATNLIVTFPTKYRHLVSKSPVDYTRPFGRPSPFNVDGSVEYAVTSFDMFENGVVTEGCYQSPCGGTSSQYITDETNYIFSGYFGQFFNAEKGWFSLDFIGPNPPVPTIAHTHRITNNNSAVDVMARK